MVTIIISGMSASGKTTLAKIIADRFALKYYGGGEALKEIAIENGFNAVGDDWWDTSEGLDFLKQRENNFEFDKKIDKKLIELAKTGNVVISSYVLPWIYDGGLNFWINASTKTRADRMSVRDNTSVSDSVKVVKIRDECNISLYKQLYDIDLNSDFSVFDYKLSTDNLSKEEIFEIAATIIKYYQ